MEVISIVNRRGGVGKTVTAWSLGAGLIHRGYQVLFVDLDSQCNLTFDVGVTSAPMTSMEVLSRTATAKEAVLDCNIGWIIPASPSLAVADTALTETGKEYRLKEALAPLKHDYDFVIVDTPPSLGVLTINALTASTSVIIPAQAEIHSIQGIGLLADTIETVKRYTNPALKVEGILITRYNKRSIIARDMKTNLEATAKLLKTKVFRTPIRECTIIKEAQAKQLDIFKYSISSNAITDYTDVLNEMDGR